MRFFFLISFFSHLLTAQVTFRPDWVNKRTNQYFNFTNSYRDQNGSIRYYDLITKTKNQVEVRRVKIFGKRSDSFEDSLKNSGFKQGATLMDKNKKYVPSIELESVTLETISGQDSVFKFRYKISLRDKKQKLLGERFVTRMGDDKNRVYKGLAGHLYAFDVDQIKGTSIIRIQFSSLNLIYPDTKYKPDVIEYTPIFYF